MLSTMGFVRSFVIPDTVAVDDNTPGPAIVKLVAVHVSKENVPLNAEETGAIVAVVVVAVPEIADGT